jgi:hypothetical protein
MVIYPVAYVVLSLPLAAGRMATAQGSTPSMAYFCLSGAMMTSSGLVDVIVYTLTRRNLLIESEPSRDRSYNHRGASHQHRPGGGNLTTTIITAMDQKDLRKRGEGVGGNPLRSRAGDRDSDDYDAERDGSTDNIVAPGIDIELGQMGKVYQETTIEITHEPAYPEDASSSGRSSQDLPNHTHHPSNANRMWGK